MSIKTTTNCPTCGQKCTVEGETTHHYVPVVPAMTRRLHDARKRVDRSLELLGERDKRIAELEEELEEGRRFVNGAPNENWREEQE